MKKAVICLVPTRDQANQIVSELQASGFLVGDISVLFPDKHATRDFAHEHSTKAPEGAVAGAATGGIVGGAVGLLAGLGLLAIPGLGPLIAAGPIVAALSGAAVGGTGGGIVGSLVGLGIPEVEAKLYEGKIRGGNLLICVHTEDTEERKRAVEIFKRARAEHISSTTEAGVPREARV